MSERLAPSHQTVRLARGKHDTPADGACVLELASMLAGEPFGDQPRSVSPVIAAYLRTYNDGADDVSRQALYGAAARGGDRRRPGGRAGPRASLRRADRGP
ncbi:MAG: hypothetical protein WKF99_10745, partial [Solirubrobacteraceae bacterium]